MAAPDRFRHPHAPKVMRGCDTCGLFLGSRDDSRLRVCLKCRAKKAGLRICKDCKVAIVVEDWHSFCSDCFRWQRSSRRSHFCFGCNRNVEPSHRCPAEPDIPLLHLPFADTFDLLD